MTARWGKLPAHAVSVNLGGVGWQVFAALCCRASDGVAETSIARLAKDCGIGRSSVTRALNRIEAAGLIQRQRRKSDRGDAARTAYRIIFSEEGGRCETEATPQAQDGGHGRRETEATVGAKRRPPRDRLLLQTLQDRLLLQTIPQMRARRA